jgi:hypothetical protein
MQHSPYETNSQVTKKIILWKQSLLPYSQNPTTGLHPVRDEPNLYPYIWFL